MAINFPNFLNAPSPKSPWEGLFENVLKGYKMSQEPAKMREEQSARQLANKLKELEVGHKPKEYELSDKSTELANSLKEKANQYYEQNRDLERRYKESQINKNLKPSSSGSPFTGLVKNYVSTHPNATPEEIQKFADRVAEAQINHTEKGSERIDVLNKTQNKRGLSPISKNMMNYMKFKKVNFLAVIEFSSLKNKQNYKVH